MLDTRYLDYFVHPQKLLKLINDFSKHQFSNWRSDSINMVISDLLKQHILMCLKDDKNMEKLHKAMTTVGIKNDKQMLILTNSGAFGFFEPSGERSVQIAIGRIEKTSYVTIALEVEYLEGKTDVDSWLYLKDVTAAKGISTQKGKEMSMEEMRETIDDVCVSFACWYLFLNCVETEQIIVQPKEKFVAKKYEGFKNQQQTPITVADLSWAKTYIQNMPSSVRGFLRNQPCGPGRLERKLIYVEPFLRSGFIRQSGKDRILKS